VMRCHTFSEGICQALDSGCFNLIDLIEDACRMKDFGILLLSVKHLPKQKLTHIDIRKETLEQTKGQ